jgi:hypothetical protein
VQVTKLAQVHTPGIWFLRESKSTHYLHAQCLAVLASPSHAIMVAPHLPHRLLQCRFWRCWPT